MPPDLRRRHHPALGLDRARPQQHLPVRLARRHREGRRVRQDLRALPPVRERGLGEAHVEADQRADAAHGAGEWRREARAGLCVRRLAQGAEVEEVQLVVAAGGVDGAGGGDPDRAVEELGGGLSGWGWLCCGVRWS